jgi:hypothetical protein
MGFLIIGRPRQVCPYIPGLNQAIASQKQFLQVAARGRVQPRALNRFTPALIAGLGFETRPADRLSCQVLFCNFL